LIQASSLCKAELDDSLKNDIINFGCSVMLDTLPDYWSKEFKAFREKVISDYKNAQKRILEINRGS